MLMLNGISAYVTLTNTVDDMDQLTGETADPLIWEDDGSDHVFVDVPSGKKATSELLTFDGDILGYA